MTKSAFRGAAALVVCFLFLSPAFAGQLAYYVQGGVLPNTATYDWYYGCSPTSAGMMMAYYDVNGYGGLSYSNLIPGGVAEPSTWPESGYATAAGLAARQAAAIIGSSPLADAAIASDGYIHDYYSSDFGTRGNNAYLNSGDDVATTRAPDSLADFMGTSQDAYSNANGSTTFYYYSDGTRTTATDIADYDLEDADGMYGIYEYFNHAGYSDPMSNFFTQLIYDASSAPYGFTFADYQAAIDSGEVVMIQVDGHSMFGYGYGVDNQIYFHDTWNNAQHQMTWGGSYSGMSQWGVTVFTPAGGSEAVGQTPEPGSIVAGAGLLALALLRKRLLA
jgi:hypothetical protein